MGSENKALIFNFSKKKKKKDFKATYFLEKVFLYVF